jgi:cell division protein FtsQ
MNAALRHPATPADVRWMNRLSIAMLVLGMLGAVAFAASRLFMLPEFALTNITVVGDVAHNNTVTIQANVAPKLNGNFYTLDLAQTRAAFEAVPWVRRALVRREFPNRLKVVLQEHQAVAYWGPEDEPKLLNNFGEVFDANVDEVDQDDLPRLNGPDSESAQVLGMYRLLKPSFQMLDVSMEELELSSRGSWRVGLDSGASIEIGTGNNDEIVLRVQRFVSTFTQVGSKYGLHADALLAADLRYPQGYSLRLRGIGTVTPEVVEKGPKK